MTVLTATTSGSMTGYFDIPAGVPAGAKEVVFTGASGSRAEAEFVGRGEIVTKELRRISSFRLFQRNRVDPVAQTFAVDESHMCAGVDVQFSAIGTSNVICELRETALGVPTQEVLANDMLLPAGVSSTSAGSWTRFTWVPVPLQSLQEYAIVLLCDDDEWAVRIATLGETDVSTSQLVSEQPYTVGVLLKSSNATAWTIDQLSDLTFRLLEPSYTSTTRVVEICSASATAADMVMIATAVERPMEGDDAKFLIVTTASTTLTSYENTPALFEAPYTGSLTVYASLTGNTYSSPRIHKDFTVLTGKGVTTGSYITRTVPCASSGGTCRATLNLTAYVISNSSITVSAQNGVDGGGAPVWSSDFDMSRNEDLGDNWYDRAYTVSELTVTDTRFKVVLHGNPQHPAFARNIQAYCIETT